MLLQYQTFTASDSCRLLPLVATSLPHWAAITSMTMPSGDRLQETWTFLSVLGDPEKFLRKWAADSVENTLLTGKRTSPHHITLPETCALAGAFWCGRNAWVCEVPASACLTWFYHRGWRADEMCQIARQSIKLPRTTDQFLCFT